MKEKLSSTYALVSTNAQPFWPFAFLVDSRLVNELAVKRKREYDSFVFTVAFDWCER